MTETEETQKHNRRLHLLLVGLLAVTLAALRILPAFTSAPDDKTQVFLGFPYSIEDSLQYADIVAQARDSGSFFFSNRFSLDPEDPRLVILPLYLTGRVAALLDLSVAGAWIWAQALLIIAFVFVFYWFLGAFFPSGRTRLFTLFFVMLAGGLDGFVVLLGSVWPEAWVPILQKNLWTVLGWTPYMTMYNPVYLAGWLVLLPWLRLVLKAMDGKLIWAALAGALLLPMYLVHAYDVVVAVLAAACLPLWALLVRTSGKECLRLLKPVGLIGLGTIPVAIFGAWQSGDPLFAAVAAKSHSGLFVSPDFWFLGFGVILLAAFYGLYRMREDSTRAGLLFGWLVAAAALSFSPFYEGRHFLYFVSLPLGMVAVDGLLRLGQRFKPSRKTMMVVAGLGLILLGNSLVRVTVRAFAHPANNQSMVVSAAELNLARELKKLPPGGVLASRNTSTWLPHISGHRAVMGHWFLSHDMNHKIGMFHQLLSPQTSPAERDMLFRRLGARYLFWGPKESALGIKPLTEKVRLLPLQNFGRAFLLEIQIPR